MKTGNSKYLNVKENQDYYKKSDGNFMPLEQCTMAHKVIDRIAWLVEKVHDLDSRTHIAIGCFPKGTRIRMSDYSNRKIEKIKVGDCVISAEGNERIVSNVFKRDYRGEIFTITTLCGEKITATEEHPVLSIQKGLLVGNKNLKYLEISKLSIGDYVAVPVVKDKNIKMANGFPFIAGWYLAEGHLLKYKNATLGVGFTLSIDEKDIALKIENYAKDNGYKVARKDRLNKSTIDIRINNKGLGTKLKKYFGSMAESKFIHRSVYGWCKEDKIQLINGLFEGDGYLRSVKNGGMQYTLTTVSSRLSKGVAGLLRSLSIEPYVFEYERPEENRLNEFLIVVMGTDINTLLKGTVKYTSKSRVKKIAGYIMLPIKDIQSKVDNIDVYNFEVEADNSYIAENIGVHNCKDGYEVMTLQAMGVDSVGVDPSEDSILEARHKADQLGYDGRKMFKLGFAEDMPEGLYADTVSCLEVIEHVVDEEKLLKVLCRLGRYVMVSTPDANGRHGLEDAKRNEEHVRLYTKEELEKLVSKFGDVKECVIRDDQILILFQPK